MKNATLLHRAEKACAKWKRKNYRVEEAHVNGLVRMLQEDHKGFAKEQMSDEEALRILMICFKDDSFYFAKRVSEYFQFISELDAEVKACDLTDNH